MRRFGLALAAATLVATAAGADGRFERDDGTGRIQ